MQLGYLPAEGGLHGPTSPKAPSEKAGRAPSCAESRNGEGYGGRLVKSDRDLIIRIETAAAAVGWKYDRAPALATRSLAAYDPQGGLPGAVWSCHLVRRPFQFPSSYGAVRQALVALLPKNTFLHRRQFSKPWSFEEVLRALRRRTR